MSKDVVKLGCPTCNRRLKIARKNISKAIVCPKCNTKFKVDEQSNTVELEGENELFGPPVSNEFSDHDLPASPFDNIDQLIESPQRGVDKPAASSDLNKAAHQPSRAAVTQASNQEKNDSSKLDEGMQRNGIGLLILATGLSLIPFFAGNVDSLQSILPFMPFLALLSAFIGSFMIAYSMRRGNIGAILVSGLPFLLIGTISLSGYFFVTRNIDPSAASRDALDNDDPPDDEPLVQVDSPDNDKFTIDRESVANRAASKFVPSKLDTDNTTKNEQTPRTHENTENSVNEQVASKDLPTPKKSALRPNAVLLPEKINESDPVEPLLSRISIAAKLATNSEKFDVLTERINRDLERGLVGREKSNLPKQFRLSDVVGRETVFGVAYFAYQPVVGFDTAHYKHSVDRWIDLIVPVIVDAEFKDSVLAGSDSKFVGVKVNFEDDGIVGLQGVFKQNDNEELKFGDWVGSPPANHSAESLIGKEGHLFGFVIYKDKLKTVGIRLIEKKRVSMR